MPKLASAAQIRAARALLGWTRAGLAEKSGVSLNAVNRMENRDKAQNHATHEKAQRQVASRAKLAPKQVRNLEQGYGGFTRRSFDTLRDYYEETGMEFFGVGVDGERSYFGVGVRWSPRALGPEPASQPVPP